MHEVDTMKTAFVFAGQGAQYEGMGKSLYETSGTARKLLDSLETHRPGLKELLFTGSKEELSRTENTQACVYAVGLMAFTAAIEAGMRPAMLAGFSLGEYCALAAGGAYTAQEGFLLVEKRAKLMAEAAKAGGGMAAVLKLPEEDVVRICAETGNVWPVNFNCPGQISCSGTKEAVDALIKRVIEAGGRALPIAVSGAFHTPLMESAYQGLQKELQGITLHVLHFPVYANTTAEPYGPEISEQLALQVKSPVLWERTIRNMAANGAEAFVELGPGKVLTGFTKRIFPDAKTANIEDAQTLEAAKKLIVNN